MKDAEDGPWFIAIQAGAMAGAYARARQTMGGRNSFTRWESAWREIAGQAISAGIEAATSEAGQAQPAADALRCHRGGLGSEGGE